MSMDVFEIIFVVGFVAGSVVRKVYTHRSGGDKTVYNRKSVLDIVLIGAGGVGLAAPLLYLFTPWLSFADYARPAWLGCAGVVVFAGAVVLLWRSHVDLGRNWSATLQIRQEHSLVTEGVYRYIRHPMYAAHLLWAIGQGLLLANWVAGWIFLVTFVPLYLVRVPKEERMMLDHFGDQYRRYMSRTGGMIPRWR